MKYLRKLAALWGILGASWILAKAIGGILPHALAPFHCPPRFYMWLYHVPGVGGKIGSVDPFNGTLHWYHWLFLFPWVFFMVYQEGFKGFQRKFSPRVVARARYLAGNATLLQGILAPFFCIGYFHGTRRRLITSWSISFAIAIVVFVVRHVPQPWRGLIDVGVVLGLAWGMIAVLVFSLRVTLGLHFDHPADLPEPRPVQPPAA